MFTLEHQDGNIEYKFEKGGFAVIDSKLYLSIQSKALEEDGFPDCYYFAIDGFPIKTSLESSKIEIATNPDDEPPNVYVYTTFHACEVEAIIHLEVISEKEIEVSLQVISEDVNYYNEKAKPNPFKGSVKLNEKNLGEMWIPS
ncbi:hypothetical protein [Pseudoalteromonas sp. B62]|uniref:hypothetical protein n=1 Tax=Pseudoalteromonas sp. B62 TaxID=630483 RepID=UPI00301D8E01